MERAAHREQAQRTAGALSFVNRARIQGHGNWIRFVGGCIPEFSIDQNRNRNQRRLPVGTQLDYTYGARAGILLARALALSRGDLGPLFLRRRKRRERNRYKQ